MKKNDIIPAKLSATVIENEIHSRLSVATEVTVLESIGSTNSWLIDKASDNNPGRSAVMQVCAAEHQTAGRGRRGKTWLSPVSGVTFSLRFTVPVALAGCGGISLLTGAAVCDGLRQWSVDGVMVKWPNDILVNDAKLVGILVEAASLAESTTALTVGVGVNYQLGAEQKKIDQTSVDLFELCDGSPPDRSVLIGHLIALVYERCCSGSVVGQMADLASEWSGYDAFADAYVEVYPGTGQAISGQADGIDVDGRLRVNTTAGTVLVSSGEVSVRRFI